MRKICFIRWVFVRVFQYNPEVYPNLSLEIETMPNYVFEVFQYPKSYKNSSKEEKEDLLLDTRLKLRTYLEKRFVEFLKISPFIVHFGKWKGQNRWPLANVETLAKVIFNCCFSNEYVGQAVNIIDSKKTTIDEYYRELGVKYFPDKNFKTITLPMWVGKIIGVISTVLSYILKTKQPVFDPSYYALHHVSSNLDFNNDKMKKILNKNIIAE